MTPMVFTKKAALRQFIFVLVIFALLIPIAMWDSNTQIKVTCDDAAVTVKSDRYTMVVGYEEIRSIQLTELAEPGEKIQDSFDDDIIRTGIWKNDTWGESYINADLDTTNCVLLRLKDDRVFVISQKNNETTLELYDTILSKLPEA